jgi:hypothetical protein
MAETTAEDIFFENFLKLNQTFGNSFPFRFHEAGLYSQVNMLLNAITFCLIRRRRLAVDMGLFPGDWADYFGRILPQKPDTFGRMVDMFAPRYAAIKYKNFKILLELIFEITEAPMTIDVPQLGLSGNLFQVQRQLAAVFCPHPLPQTSLSEERYVSCHVRRGDKLIKEGEFNSARDYIEVARHLAPGIKHLHVIADDYAVIEEFRHAAAGFSISTACQPDESGYVNAKFIEQNLDVRRKETSKLIREVAVAMRSDLFIGCYLSNLSRFVALTHHAPEACISVDALKHWTAVPKNRAAH